MVSAEDLGQVGITESGFGIDLGADPAEFAEYLAQ
jgi:hypothetical protein